MISSGKRWWVLSSLLALVVFLVFVDCVPNAFVLDDEPVILKNTYLTSVKYIPNLLTENILAGAGVTGNTYRPFEMLTHFLDVQLFGYQPWGHHLSSVLWHVACAVALFHMLAGLFPLGAAFLAAAFFSLHPLHSGIVAIVSGRADTLVMLFIFLGLWAFRRNLWLSLLCAALAIGSKESGVLFPILLVLYDRATGPPSPRLRHLPFWLLAELYVIARLTVLNFHNTLNFYDTPDPFTEHFLYRVCTYVTTLSKGVVLWLQPNDLHPLRDWPMFTSVAQPAVWLSLIAVMLLALTAFRMRRSRPRVAAGIAWFFVATLPTSNLAAIIYARLYDHWFLLPGVGLLIAATDLCASAWTRWTRPRLLITVAALVAIACVSVVTARYNLVWRTPISLNTYILAWEPRSAKTAHNLALAYAEQGDHAKAIALYRRALSLRDDFTRSHYQLGREYAQMGDGDRALQQFQRTVELDPRFSYAWLEIGNLLLARGDLEEAAVIFQRVIGMVSPVLVEAGRLPRNAEAFTGLAQVYVATQQVEAADTVLEAGARRFPGHPDIMRFHPRETR